MCEDFPCCGHETPSDCSMTPEQYEAERRAIWAEVQRADRDDPWF
jgi:hypothetical protein